MTTTVLNETIKKGFFYFFLFVLLAIIIFSSVMIVNINNQNNNNNTNNVTSNYLINEPLIVENQNESIKKIKNERIKNVKKVTFNEESIKQQTIKSFDFEHEFDPNSINLTSKNADLPTNIYVHHELIPEGYFAENEIYVNS